MSWIYNHSVAVLMSISQHKFMSKTKNEAPNLEHGLMKRVLFSKVKEEIRQMFTGLVENVQTFGRTSSFSHIKTADSSHLSLQRNVVVQPFEGIQQRLLGVWNFARAENRERERERERYVWRERKPEVENRDQQLHYWQNNRRACVGVLLQATDENKVRNREVWFEMLANTNTLNSNLLHLKTFLLDLDAIFQSSPGEIY